MLNDSGAFTRKENYFTQRRKVRRENLSQSLGMLRDGRKR